MADFKIDPAKYMGLSREEVSKRMVEDERKHINADPGLRSCIRDMDRRAAEKQAAEERHIEEQRREQEKEFDEALERHYRDRMEFYRMAKGVYEAIFCAELWPEIRGAFVSGEADAVDWERMKRSTDVY
jgi:hypothetical protein